MEYYEVKGSNCGYTARFKIKPAEKEIIERLLAFLEEKHVIVDWTLNTMETI